MAVGSFDGRKILATYAFRHSCTKPINVHRSQPRPQSQGRGPTTQPQEHNSTLTRGETLTPRAQFHANEWNQRGRSPHPHHIYQGRGPTTQPQERNSTLTSRTHSRMRKGRGLSTHPRTRSTTTIPPALYPISTHPTKAPKARIDAPNPKSRAALGNNHPREQIPPEEEVKADKGLKQQASRQMYATRDMSVGHCHTKRSSAPSPAKLCSRATKKHARLELVLRK